MTTEVSKLLYIVVVDDEGTTTLEESDNAKTASFWYTRPVLQSTLQFMGCKPRHAFKISQQVFDVVRGKSELYSWPPDGVEGSGRLNGHHKGESCCARGGTDCLVSESDAAAADDNGSYDSYKRCTAFIKREMLMDIICSVLADYKYVGPTQRDDLILACRIRERKESVTILLCGTSGCGKSTLSALLGSRLGLTTVISTDSIRHMMRSFASENQNPLLWASTYHAGECLDPIAVAEAKAKRKANKVAHSDEVSDEAPDGKPLTNLSSSSTDVISAKQMAVEGYKAQSEMVIESLDRLITAWERRKESVVVEGVHLSLNFVVGLMKKHPSIIPFMVYIENEDKHLERFAVRAKYMTLDPSKNKYVKYFQNIRTIQEYLCKRADKHLVPKINNTNVDRSVAAIHATVFSSLRRREAGEQFYDPDTNTVSLVDEEHRNLCTASSLSSKGVFQLIQRQGSSRHMMALINKDGSVAKAWPLGASAARGKSFPHHDSEKNTMNPLYGPFSISKAESVNLQFGDFGISAWPSDIGASSQGTSVDDSYLDAAENESRYQSSSSSSPRMSDGHTKEVKDRSSVSGSDEEAENSPNTDSDSDDESEKQIHDELEGGSVDEDSVKSDDEYEDLAIKDL